MGRVGVVRLLDDSAGIGGGLPAPAAAGEWAPNLPAGMTEEIDIEFTEWPAEGFYNTTTQWLWTGAGTQVTADSAFDTEYGPEVARTTYPGNHAGGGGGGLKIESNAVGAKRLYICFEQILLGSGGSPYVTHTNREKLIYPLRALAASGPAIELAIPTSGSAGGPARFEMLTQINDANWLVQPANGVYVPKGTKHIIECYLQMNTGSNANGVWQMWIDGVEAVNMTDVQYSNSGSSDSFEYWRLDGTRGGGDSSVLTPAGGQFREWSRIQVYKSASLP